MLSYGKLWVLLEQKGLKKVDLKQIISGNTIAKLAKNENVNTEIIEKICGFLDCQPNDIMEYVSDKKIQETLEKLDIVQKLVFENLKEQGMTEEEFMRIMNDHVKDMFNGESTFSNSYKEHLKKGDE